MSARHNLLPHQRVFCDLLIRTGSVAYAERGSGLNRVKAFQSTAVALEIRDGVQSRLLSFAPMAIKILTKLAIDPAIPPAIRRLAASDLLDRAGIGSHAALALAQPIESLSEMPARSLRALVERLETELFARSTPVRALELESPDSTPADDKPLSVLD